MTDKFISGSGGGGGKGGGGGGSSRRAPIESPDSLRSKQFARIIDAIGEGEIVGLVDGLKSVYFDDTPVQNADGTLNFSGVTIDQRTGMQAQSYIPGFSETEAENAVATKVTAAISITRTIVNANVNAVRVTLGFPRMAYQDQNSGDLGGTSAQIAIDLQTNGGGFIPLGTDIITGKCSTLYERAYRVQLSGSGPWDVRVRRITPDSTQSNLANETWWESYTEIIEQKLRYPNTALIGVQVDATQFRSVPKRGYLVRGLKVKIPSNYNPSTRAYAGDWNGTFTVGWTDNPAWVFYDLVTEARYGLGTFIGEAQVDKWALYAIARYCDALVPNGFGGMEPRYTCNVCINTQEDTFKLLNHFASIFAGICFWSGSQIVAVQDAPSDSIALYTNANVIGGAFTYEGSSRAARHTAAIVMWNDPNNRYKQVPEYVPDRDGIARYGFNPVEVVAMGCTSRGQAHRFGKSILYAETHETETVSFRVGLDGVVPYPGSIIQIADAPRAGIRMGGRVASATKTAIVTDANVTLDDGLNTLSVILPDGTVGTTSISNGAGTFGTLNLSPALSAIPVTGAIWVVSNGTVAPTTWRVLSVAEVERGMQYEVIALSHSANKYAEIERDIVLEDPPTSILSSIYQAPVASVELSDYITALGDGTIQTRLVIAWPISAGAIRYIVEVRKGEGNWTTITEYERGISHEVFADDGASYMARVTAVSAIGVLSAGVSSIPYIVQGKMSPPPDVDVFLVAAQSDGTRQFSWVMSVRPPDLAGFRIKYHSGTGWTWADLLDLHTGLLPTSPWETNQLAAGNYTFGIVAVDTTGHESSNAKFITGSLPDPRLAGVLVSCYDSSEGWPGTKTNCHYQATDGTLQPNETSTSAWNQTWITGHWIKSPSGTIQYVRQIDIGAVIAFTPLVSADGDGTMTLEEQHSNDNVTYSSYSSIGPMVTARYIRVRLTLSGAWPMARNLVTHISAQSKSETINDKSTSSLSGGYRIGTGDIRLPIVKSYSLITQVSVTLQNVGAGWSWELIDKNTSPGPRIKIYNASNAAADAIIDAEVKGI